MQKLISKFWIFSITVHVANNGFDDVEQVFTATEDTDKMMLGMNPTVSEYCITLFSIPPWIVHLFKKLSIEKRDTIQIFALLKLLV